MPAANIASRTTKETGVAINAGQHCSHLVYILGGRFVPWSLVLGPSLACEPPMRRSDVPRSFLAGSGDRDDAGLLAALYFYQPAPL